MTELAEASKIKVMSISSFEREAFDFRSYITIRESLTFGSAINPTTGEPDKHNYIPVHYTDDSERNNFSINDIANKIIRKEKIILLGEYGTGKSRCTKEVFRLLSDRSAESKTFTLSINLREHWGSSTAVEIVAGHLQRLGMSTSIDRVMQLLNSGKISLILDGFDEVGSQTFGTNQDRRAGIRKIALQGIRDLIGLCKAGLLITGRPHYFNSNKEMFESLGLSLKTTNVTLLRCSTEFNEEQAKSYLRSISLPSIVPGWLPRKPLMFLILSEIDKSEAEKIIKSESGELGFWGQFLDTVCEREAKIHSSIDPISVRNVLTNLASITRKSDRELGRLTPKDVNSAYEDATGVAPDESGQLMLSRLCTLGRIEPESPDRQFVDPYIVQLLYAENIVDFICNKEFHVLEEKWKQPLNESGTYFLAQWIETYDLEQDALGMIHRKSDFNNSQIISELISSLALINGPQIDLQGLRLHNAELAILILGGREISNISFIDCIFRLISFEECKISNESNVSIINPLILMATGLTSRLATPAWIKDPDITETQSASNSSLIKSSNLPPSQKLFLSIIQKIFFQRGGGRKENSLYKGGFGQEFDRKLIDLVLKTLVSENLIEKSKDSSGFIYNPKREHTARMKAIKDQLGLSKDPLWQKISNLG